LIGDFQVYSSTIPMATTFPTVKNCPQLIIGAPSDVSSQDAVAAFARASKRLKNDPNVPFTLEDLTSALSAIEAKNRSDESGLKYSIPADPSVFKKDLTFDFDGELYKCDSDLSSIDVTKIDTSKKDNVAKVFLAAAIHQLLNWNWEQASEYARICLRLSAREDERDEALNVIAASLAAQGDDERALDALKKAVEGQWNLPLQANLALIAIEIDPDLAVEHISYLVDGAKTAEDKIRACSTAIGIWTASQKEQTGSDDQDDFDPLPRTFLNSIQSIIVSPEITEETFYDYGKFLARVDAEEFQKSRIISKSVHSKSPSATVINARLKGLGSYLEELVKVSSKNSVSKFPWLHDEVNGFVRSINSNLFEDDADSLHFNLGMAFLNNGLDCATRERVVMRGVLVLKLSKFLEEDAQPSDKFIEWLSAAQVQVRNHHSKLDLDEEDQEALMNLLYAAGNHLLAVIADSLVTQGRSLQPIIRSMQSQMTGFFNRMSANKAEIASRSSAILEWCNEATLSLDSAEKLSNDSALKEGVKAVYKSISSLKNSVIQYT
jgi:hypothetical protein